MANIDINNKEEFYETPNELVDLMIKRSREFNIKPKEILDNSYGNGNILKPLLEEFKCDYIAYDIIDREYDLNVKVGDYLKEKIEYREDRVAFINPPWTKGLKFCYKSLEECSICIAVLAPTSLLSLNYNEYEVISSDFIKKTPFSETKYLDCVLLIIKKKINNEI